MARQKLGLLLEAVERDVPAEASAPAPTPAPATEQVPAPRPEAAKKPAPRKTPARVELALEVDQPLYLALTRKETRLRSDQIAALGELARGLNRAKKGKGPRITDNTLIRVAVDMLLERADKLKGDDEVALRESITP
ncbi:hypothetical protein [uncultured Microbacterium sp.]|uniref:hypothetical protein n=1 Tax=uncultured Microbacterium sp. TaxID=191216 RepID=UPI002606ABD7|nr:hypothetical protein [uncultured Microbacterium sp.]